MPTYLDSGRSHHSQEADWVAFGGGGAAAQAAVAKRCPGPEPETTAARRRRCGGGSSLLAGVEGGVRVREKLHSLEGRWKRVILGFQEIFEFEQNSHFFSRIKKII